MTLRAQRAAFASLRKFFRKSRSMIGSNRIGLLLFRFHLSVTVSYAIVISSNRVKPKAGNAPLACGADARVERR